jgi:hypothetical protein
MRATERGFLSLPVLPVFFVLATILGFAMVPADDICKCNWKGTWNGSGFTNFVCTGTCSGGSCAPAAAGWPDTFICGCSATRQDCACFGLAQALAGEPGAWFAVTCNEVLPGCSLNDAKCIAPDQSMGWNGQIGTQYVLCQCLKPAP